MTKGEKRRARKAARAAGRPLTGELGLSEIGPWPQCPNTFTETPAGDRARERWARHYDALDGAPEGDWDR